MEIGRSYRYVKSNLCDVGLFLSSEDGGLFELIC